MYMYIHTHNIVGECVTETQALGYESTYSLLGFESKDSVSPHHQENTNGGRETKGIKNAHHHNSKVAATVDRNGVTQRENDHQVSDEEEGGDKDHIYFVLESPTKPAGPVKADRERQEVDKERQEVERQEVERQEVEDAAATPYEIPIALYNTKKNKQNTVVKNTGAKNTDRS